MPLRLACHSDLGRSPFAPCPLAPLQWGPRSKGSNLSMETPAPSAPRVGLFATCLVDLFRPSIGFAAVKLLEDAGCIVEVPSQTCCGQPAFNSGDKGHARALALQVIKAFEAFDYIVVPSGSCGGMIAKHYPELFAGVGAHSGLPYGSAHDIPSAMAAMKGGRSGLAGVQTLPDAAAQAPRKAVQPVPLIVFHGDRDHTVQHTNGAEIVRQAREAHASEGAGPLIAGTQVGESPRGRRYIRTLHADETGQTQIESWTLHGAGHAWSGGDSRGSYTDGAGPDASTEMVRFFLALPRAGTA